MTPREALAAAFEAGEDLGTSYYDGSAAAGPDLAQWLQTAEGKEAFAAVSPPQNPPLAEPQPLTVTRVQWEDLKACLYPGSPLDTPPLRANPVSITKRTASGLTTSTDGGETWTEETT